MENVSMLLAFFDNAHLQRGYEIMKILVENFLSKVILNQYYRGKLRVGATLFSYELTIMPQVEVRRLNIMVSGRVGYPNPKEDRRAFVLNLKREGVLVELSDDEYGFFFGTLSRMINQVQNDSLFSFMIASSRDLTPHEEEIMAQRGEFILCQGYQHEFPQETVEMLNTPKFGCSLA